MRYLLLLPLFYVSCKKSDSQSAVISDEPACVQQRSVHNGDTVAGQYIIVYDPGTISKSMSGRDVGYISERLLQKHRINSAALLQSFAGEPGGFIAKLSPSELTKLRQDDAVSNIEPDRVIALGTCFTVAAPWLITWNINRVGYGDGTGKVAWVIDTGIDLNHPDLTTDATRSRSFISGQSSAADENGHGTHVAGIIAAKNNNFGVLGVASGATLVSLRVLDESGEGLLSNIILALSYASATAKAGDVVNMSLGQEGISNILDQKVLSTASKGILISIAAGNDNKPANQFSPSRVNGQNIYTVSAIDSTGKFASFSNYGNDAVDYAAPGVRILSTYLNNRYAIMSGTSMAAPHVAGLLLLKGNNINVSGTASNDPDGVADAIAHY
jgi:subtilisin family serine protease